MRSLLIHVLLPLAAIAATAVPTDPARAGEKACPRASAAAHATQVVRQEPVRVEAKRGDWRLEAL